MAQTEQSTAPANTLKCSNCGATLQFAPGTHSLTCQYCGVASVITDENASPILPYDYTEFVALVNGGAASSSGGSVAETARVVSCKNCGASTTLPGEVNSDTCVFCASPLVLTDAQTKQIVQPHYVLPFIVPQATALEDFRGWIKRLWWAPGDLSKLVSGNAHQFKGIYIPHWSYDASTISEYVGSRG